jgi:hypothetical protein
MPGQKTRTKPLPPPLLKGFFLFFRAPVHQKRHKFWKAVPIVFFSGDLRPSSPLQNRSSKEKLKKQLESILESVKIE